MFFLDAKYFSKFPFLRMREVASIKLMGVYFSAFGRFSNLLGVSAKKEKGLLQI